MLCLKAKSFFVALLLSLFLLFSSLNSFALGSGTISPLVAGHNGLSIIVDDTHSFALDNTFVLTDSRYRWIESTYATFDGALEGYIYGNVSDQGDVLRTEFYGLLGGGRPTTISFNEFVPYGTWNGILSGQLLYRLWSVAPFDYDLTATVVSVDSATGKIYERTIERWGQSSTFNVTNGQYEVSLIPFDEFGVFDLGYNKLEIDVYQFGSTGQWLNIDVPICEQTLLTFGDRVNGYFSTQSDSEVNILDRMIGWIDDFLSIDLFGFGDVAVSLGDLIGLILAISCAIWVLKLVGGG